jgi:hypothetical protein
MATQLKQLLHDIDPSRVNDPIGRRVDEAINSFPVKSVRINDWRAVKELMARLFVHIESRIMRMRSCPNADLEFSWGRCCQTLKKVYGSEAQHAIIHGVLSGTDGGLRSVIHNLGSSMAEEYARREICARVAHYWSGLSVDEKLADSEAYLASWGHLLPLDVREDGAARLRAFFPQYLEEHPFALQRLRAAGRLTRT